MARSGTYKWDVKKARDSLIAQGIYPSAQAVRKALGDTGSISTIHKYLKEIEEEGDETADGRDPLSESITDLISQLAARLRSQADERISAVMAERDAETMKHEAILLESRQEYSKLLAQLQQVEAAYEEQDAVLIAVREEMHHEATARQVALQELADLKVRLGDLEKHRDSLEKKHTQAREALDHYRQSVVDQREADARRHEEQQRQLQAELRLAQQTIAVKQEETTRLNREGVRHITDLTHTRQLLSAEEERAKQLKREVEELREIAIQRDVLSAQAIDKDSQIMDLRNQVTDLRQQLGASATKQEGFLEQLRNTETALAKANARADANESIATQLRTLLEQGNATGKGG